MFFDKLADTGYDIVAGEEGGAYSLYTSVGVRDRVDLFAAKISGEHYTSIEVTVYASNDNAEWVQLNVSQPMEQNGFQVFYMAGDGERYTFYRFDFKMIMGDSFTLSELALFKDDLGEPEYIYVLGDTVEDGQLQRKKLGAIVFADEAALADLNRITHSAVKKEVLHRLENRPELAAIDAIGLIEGGLAELCDVTVAVTAPLEDRVKRIMARDGISEEYARNRIAAQKNDTWFRNNCHRVLVNDGTKADFQSKCVAFLQDVCIIKT